MISPLHERESEQSGSRFVMSGGRDRWREWGGLLAVLLVTLACVGYFQFASGGDTPSAEPDVYFHLGMARWLQEHGIWLKTFDRATESIWLEHWFDKDWLFHLFLIPWRTLFGDLVGSKVAVLALNGGILTAFWLLLRASGVGRGPRLLWLLLLPWAGGWILWLRLMLCRPHLLGLFWLFAALVCMQRRRGPWLALVAALFAVSHSSHWVLPAMVLVYDVAWLLTDEDGRPRAAGTRPWRAVPMVVWAVGGIVVGTLLHPNFPNNIHGLFVQNVLVLTTTWNTAVDMEGMSANELKPLGMYLFVIALPLTVGLIAAALGVATGSRRWSRALWYFGVYAGGFAVLAYTNLRFIDYAAPFGVLWLAQWFTRNPLFDTWREREAASPADGALASPADGTLFGATPLLPWVRLTRLVLLGSATIYMVHAANRDFFYDYGEYVVARSRSFGYKPQMADVARWIDTHLEADSIVYTSDWGDPPGLFFGAPRQRYLNFLDPMFMYQHDRDRFIMWRAINSGGDPDPATSIRAFFHANVAVVKRAPLLQAALDASPDARLMLVGPQGERLYALRPLRSPPVAAPPPETAP